MAVIFLTQRVQQLFEKTLSFIYDKLTDGVFVFLGVILAFAFDQYKEDKRSQASLKFNMEQIIRDLPAEEPSGRYPKFEITQEKVKGTCMILMNLGYVPPVGEFYLDTISNNDLARHLENRSVVPQLINYYKVLIPKVKKTYKIVNKHLEAAALKTWTTKNKECIKTEQIKLVEEKIRPHYLLYATSKVVSEFMGYRVRKELLDMRFAERPKDKSEYLRIELKEEDNSDLDGTSKGSPSSTD